MHPVSVRTNHCTSQYRSFAVSYRPGPVGLWYSPREVCASVARGTLTILWCLLHPQSCLLGSAILPPSHVPERNPMFPYIALLCVFLCFRPVSASHLDSSPLYCTSHYFTSFTSVHLSISHPSPVPPIFLSVRLDYPWTPLGLAFHPIIPVLARIVFKD